MHPFQVSERNIIIAVIPHDAYKTGLWKYPFKPSCEYGIDRIFVTDLEDLLFREYRIGMLMHLHQEIVDGSLVGQPEQVIRESDPVDPEVLDPPVVENGRAEKIIDKRKNRFFAPICHLPIFLIKG